MTVYSLQCRSIQYEYRVYTVYSIIYVVYGEGETLTYEVCGREVPVASWETASKVMTPRDILPGTDSMSIQKETQETATIRIEGR